MQEMARLHPHYTVTIPDYDEDGPFIGDIGDVEYDGEEITIRPGSYYNRPFCAICGEPIDGFLPPKQLKGGAYICPKCEINLKGEYTHE